VEELDRPADHPRPTADQDHQTPSAPLKNRGGGSRLNRGGDRQANAALWRIAMVRLRYDQPTRDYLAKRQAEGKTKSEGIRCLKRYIARAIYYSLPKAALS